MEARKKVNVICIKWGDVYPAREVNLLYKAIQKNTSYQVVMHCFTENADGLDASIIHHPLPSFQLAPERVKYAYRKEAGLCDDELGGLRGQRVFFFDLDSLIVGNLDEFFDYPKDDKFYIINDWAHRSGAKKDKVGQASCYSFVVGTLGYVKEYFEAHPEEVIEKFYTASQEYLSSKVIERQGALAFWPDNWFKSYRFHCLPLGILRRFVAPKMPQSEGLKMIAFHGVTGIDEAIDGLWVRDPNHPKRPRGLKKIYKCNLPAPWIKKFRD